MVERRYWGFRSSRGCGFLLVQVIAVAFWVSDLLDERLRSWKSGDGVVVKVVVSNIGIAESHVMLYLSCHVNLFLISVVQARFRVDVRCVRYHQS